MLFPVYIDKGSNGIIIVKRVVTLNTWNVFGCDEYLKKTPKFIFSRCLQPLACWDCVFESRLGHGCLFILNVVCCLVEVSATGRSVVQRRPTKRVCVCHSSMISCNSNPLHRHWVGRQRSVWERKEEKRKFILTVTISVGVNLVLWLF